ncbi:MAG: cysteine--tRNA ligase [Isosphaeraceae bacterium]|jgi:cysteinyl-tRNA synthetase|nr:MAG: cysteine--tRNA ligase [Isosphaeraceae bacterium]
MPIRIYNTLTQTKELFETIRPGQVGMYVCGPTVYSYSHIGHMVGPVIFDTVKRHLEHSGYRVTWVVNITDVDDKLIQRVQEQGATPADMAARVKQLAEEVTADYRACLEALGVDGIDHMPRATEHIEEIVRITSALIEKGHAYASDGDVYFDVTTDPDYGKLSHRDPAQLEAGARIEPSEKKRHPGDFALWKGSKPGEPAWPSPWGPGRPGWHIECSAMSMKLLGPHFDIHGGGLDLVFPHHENEVAQSESYSGAPLARYWMHTGLLTRGGRKISKSDPETVVEMRDLLARHEPDTIRALLLSSHYRRPIDYSNERLAEVARGLEGFWNLIERFERLTGRDFYALEAPRRRDEPPGHPVPEEVAALRSQFLEAMDDDFNTGGALGTLYELVRAVNRYIDQNQLEARQAEAARLAPLVGAMVVLRELTGVLGLFRRRRARTAGGADRLTGPLLDLLVGLRAELRKQKQFELADRIRARLAELGVVLEDGPQGTRWKTTDG